MPCYQFPWDLEPGPVAAPPPLQAPDPQPKRRGRRPGVISQGTASAAAKAPDWLYHHLTVSGPADEVAGFATAARGSGVIPWRLDFAALEEDIFVRAVSQPARRRSLSIDGCRILARQFREKVEVRQAQAAALVGQSLACPLDLHTLVPVPAAILSLGPTDPAALAWLRENWGISDRLRQVCVRPDASTGRRRPHGHAVIGYGFFTLGETPQAAMDTIAARWPGLRCVLVPRPVR